jgi:hypothetical protein
MYISCNYSSIFPIYGRSLVVIITSLFRSLVVIITSFFSLRCITAPPVIMPLPQYKLAAKAIAGVAFAPFHLSTPTTLTTSNTKQ